VEIKLVSGGMLPGHSGNHFDRKENLRSFRFSTCSHAWDGRAAKRSRLLCGSAGWAGIRGTMMKGRKPKTLNSPDPNALIFHDEAALLPIPAIYTQPADQVFQCYPKQN
jgi:hypothetical protein